MSEIDHLEASAKDELSGWSYADGDDGDRHGDGLELSKECAGLCALVATFHSASETFDTAELDCGRTDAPKAAWEVEHDITDRLDRMVRSVARLRGTDLHGLAAKKSVIEAYLAMFGVFDSRVHLLLKSFFDDFDHVALSAATRHQPYPANGILRLPFRFNLSRMLTGTWRNGGQ